VQIHTSCCKLWCSTNSCHGVQKHTKPVKTWHLSLPRWIEATGPTQMF
jgi:hypothetical protein